MHFVILVFVLLLYISRTLSMIKKSVRRGTVGWKEGKGAADQDLGRGLQGCQIVLDLMRFTIFIM